MGRRCECACNNRRMHLVFAVADVGRSYQFYREVFGWKSHLEWPGEYTELVVSDEDRLGLYRRDGYAVTAGAEPAELNGRVSPAYLYLRVEDLDEAIARLKKAGAKPLSRRSERSWGEEAAYFADPDGNVVAVARKL
jgi:catechol 2,3-dioxygenase-like lactoylglutathione lyase family enzyme